jgi:hypothetical protein
LRISDLEGHLSLLKLMRTSLYLHLLHQLLHKMFQLFSPVRLELDPLQELVLSY